MVPQFVVMGVSGCGKSTLAQALAVSWGVCYVEGDELHAPASVAKMAAGIALEDSDRWPWLDRVGVVIGAAVAANSGAVASCSALRLVYRDRLRHAVGPHLRFVMINLSQGELEQRMHQRAGHYMPPTLLQSQLATLERPVGEADVLIVDGRQSLDTMVALVSTWRASALA